MARGDVGCFVADVCEAGGLVFFKGRKDVKIWIHEKELKHAYWGMASKTDSSYMYVLSRLASLAEFEGHTTWT
jgi:hypothetical protein